MFDKIDFFNKLIVRCVNNSYDNKTHARQIDDAIVQYRRDLDEFNEKMRKCMELAAEMEDIALGLAELTETVLI